MARPNPNPLAGVPPDDFVTARNELVRQLRDRGEAEEARRIAALRRPSTVLWLLNQLGSRAAQAVEALIESTSRARRTQMTGASGQELREAMHAQREATQKLLGVAHDAAGEIGAALSPEQERRIKETLHAAAATNADALRNGTVEHELSPSGFDALLTGHAPPASRNAPRQSPASDRAEKRDREREEKQRRKEQLRAMKNAQRIAGELDRRAAVLQDQAREATEVAERAKEKAEAARRAAADAATRLQRLRQETGHSS